MKLNKKQIKNTCACLSGHFGKIITLLLLVVYVHAQESKDSLNSFVTENSQTVTESLKTEKSTLDKQRNTFLETYPTQSYIKRDFPFSEKTKTFRFSSDVLVSQSEKEDRNKVDNGKGDREKWVIPRGAKEKGVEVGYGLNMATWLRGPRIYDIRGLRHFLGSVRWGKVLGTKGIVTFSWAIEVIPINVAIRNEVVNDKYTAGSDVSPTKRENTFGFAINPSSFRFIFFPKLRLRPQLGGGIGMTYHFNPVPTTQGTRLNAQWDFQFGAQYMLKQHQAINFGYRYYHISHSKFAPPNPAYNVNMIFIGFSTFKKQ